MCYTLNMTVKRTAPAVCDTNYHLLWAPIYRKWIPRLDIRKRVKSIFEEVALNLGFEIDTMEVAPDHVHVFLSFPLQYGIFKLLETLKSVNTGVFFHEHQEVKKHLQNS